MEPRLLIGYGLLALLLLGLAGLLVYSIVNSAQRRYERRLRRAAEDQARMAERGPD